MAVAAWGKRRIKVASNKLKIGSTKSRIIKGLVKKYGEVGRIREGVGHEVLSLVQGVGRAIFSYP